MSSLPEKVEVVCPKCGEEFAAWSARRSDPATSSTCPRCRFELMHDATVRQEGAWQPELDEPEAVDR